MSKATVWPQVLNLAMALTATAAVGLFPPWVATRFEVKRQVLGIIDRGDVEETKFLGFRFIGSRKTRTIMSFPFGLGGAVEVSLHWPLLIGEWIAILAISIGALCYRHASLAVHSWSTERNTMQKA